MYRNVCSKPETAEYIAWAVTADGQAARERMRRTITWQDTGTALETEFYYSVWSGNLAAKALALSCGFVFRYAERKTDLRSGEPYQLEIYRKDLKDIGSV